MQNPTRLSSEPPPFVRPPLTTGPLQDPTLDRQCAWCGLVMSGPLAGTVFRRGDSDEPHLLMGMTHCMCGSRACEDRFHATDTSQR